MCIAILTLPYKELTDAALKNSASNNPDGFGFSYVRQDLCGVRKLIVKKTMDYDTFYRQYKRAFFHNPESVFLIHFRIATHGTVDKFNCHPFYVDKETSIIHNGVISGIGFDKDRSDTQLFNDKVLKNLGKGWQKSPAIKLLLEKFLVGSKLITLNVDNEYQIFNEEAGHWKEGVWYSNHSYSYNRVTTYRTPGALVPTVYGKKKDSTEPYYLCDGCGMRQDSDGTTFFLSKGEPFCYCKDCVTVAYFNGTVNLTDKVGKRQYNRAMAGYKYGFGSQEYSERYMD